MGGQLLSPKIHFCEGQYLGPALLGDLTSNKELAVLTEVQRWFPKKSNPMTK